MRGASFVLIIIAPFICTSAKSQSLSSVQRECLSGPMNSPTCVKLRAEDARKHPDRSYADAECDGLMDPQPQGHPPPLSECDGIVRLDQERMGLPITGLSQQQIEGYYRTWGNS
jgi:hypothetical protein